VVTKDDTGKVHVNKGETATRHGAWGGAAVGAAVGILFPPSILAACAVGAAVGGVGGHLWNGMSRADVKEFGESSFALLASEASTSLSPGGVRRFHSFRMMPSLSEGAMLDTSERKSGRASSRRGDM
jgi:hypothetical protein